MLLKFSDLKPLFFNTGMQNKARACYYKMVKKISLFVIYRVLVKYALLYNTEGL